MTTDPRAEPLTEPRLFAGYLTFRVHPDHEWGQWFCSECGTWPDEPAALGKCKGPSWAERAARQPASPDLRAALIDMTAAYHQERRHDGRWDACQRPRCQNARLAMEGRGPLAMTDQIPPVEPLRPDLRALEAAVFAAAFSATDDATDEPIGFEDVAERIARELARLRGGRSETTAAALAANYAEDVAMAEEGVRNAPPVDAPDPLDAARQPASPDLRAALQDLYDAVIDALPPVGDGTLNEPYDGIFDALAAPMSAAGRALGEEPR